MMKSQDLADQARTEIAELLDLQLSPLGTAAMDALAPITGQSILDVGCGTGQTVKQLAERVGITGRVIGVDIATRSLELARSRTEHLPQTTLIQIDAEVLDLPDASVDGIYSRFGVMFFADPVSAFSNLRRIVRPGGRIAFVCWRSLLENEIDYLPLQAAGLKVPADEAPFSFERPGITKNTLLSAGFDQIAINKLDTAVSCGDIDATMIVLSRVGPLGKILRETPALMTKAAPKVRAALSARNRNGRIVLGAATWIVSAVAK